MTYEDVSARAEKKFSREYELKRRGYDIEKVEERVSEVLEMPVEEVRKRGREMHKVKARSLAIYWAERELNIAGVALARRYGLTQSAIVHADRRGEKIARELNCELLT